MWLVFRTLIEHTLSTPLADEVKSCLVHMNCVVTGDVRPVVQRCLFEGEVNSVSLRKTGPDVLTNPRRPDSLEPVLPLHVMDYEPDLVDLGFELVLT